MTSCNFWGGYRASQGATDIRLQACVCELKQDHTVQRRSCRHVPGGRAYMTTALLATGQLQAGRRYPAKEVRFPGFRPEGDGERRADHSGKRGEAQVVRESSCHCDVFLIARARNRYETDMKGKVCVTDFPRR